MAVAHSKTYFDRFQVETTGPAFQTIRSYPLRPSSAFRFEFVVEAFDGTEQASFRRVLAVKRGPTGPAEVVGRIWHASETTKSKREFDLQVELHPDGSFSIQAKNATALTTTWKGSVERLAVSR